MFCGSRGTGKTSCAKILAKAVNCESPRDGEPCGECESCRSIDNGSAADFVEMDAASDTGVDYIREIKEEVQYPPAILKKKVYIIDEVHMLTDNAFNALLKTLEEPPEHVIFILATTELHKIPATVISRCQRFDFRRLSVDVICDRLFYIAEKEGISLERSAAVIIAKQAQGGMRDAISLFELCSGGGADVTEERVFDILGVSGYERVHEAALAVNRKDMARLFEMISDVASSSKDISVFWQELTSFYRDMMVAKYVKDLKSYLDLTDGEFALLSDAASKFSLASLFYQSKILDETLKAMNRMPQTKRMSAEFALMKMCDPSLNTSADALLSRVEALEEAVLCFDARKTLAEASSFGGAVSDEKPDAVSNDSDISKDREGASRAEEGKDAAASKKSEKDDAENETGRGVENQRAGKAGGENAADSNSPDNDYIPVRDLSEVCERVGRSDFMCRSILSEADCEVSPDGRVLRIITDNPFAETYFTAPVKKVVSDAFAACRITEYECEVRLVLKKKKTSDPSDELFG